MRAVIWLLACITLAPSLTDAQTTNGETMFSIRADPSVAAQVNRVLAKVAKPVTTDVSPQANVQRLLQERCGVDEVPQVFGESVLENGKKRVTYAPCARLGGARTITVEPGLTLEGIAARWGLRPNKVTTLVIRPGPGNPKRSTIAPETMLPGDLVVMPQSSLWTDFRVNADSGITDREQMVAALAQSLGCREEVNECVIAKGVLLLTHGQPDSMSPPPQSIRPSSSEAASDERPAPGPDLSQVYAGLPEGDVPSPEWPAISSHVASMHSRNDRGLDFGEIALAEAQIDATDERLVATANIEIEPSVPPTTHALGQTRWPIGVPVAADQWPYDKERVRRVLQATRDTRHYVRVGVADGGLRDNEGLPIPLAARERNSGELNGGEVNDDDDANLYIDDFYGAGVRRPEDASLASDIRGTGNLSLCSSESSFASWSGRELVVASHASVVASIAAGWPLRNDAVDLKLPRIMFFRLVPAQCDPHVTPHIAQGEVNNAIEYLFDQHMDVVNLSMKLPERGYNQPFLNATSSIVNGDTRMLVVAAGNNDSDDLDEGNVCPACLGTPYAESLAKRVVVVGAAERDLRANAGSNKGKATVQFYAPGQAHGMNLLGNDPEDSDYSTSYAAPVATLAVALLKSYGVSNYWEIKERLDAASWPLLNEDGAADDYARVIDLTKVVAVHNDAIEAVVVEAGEPVRRTYVGRIADRLSDVSLCAGESFRWAQLHSIRFGPTQSDGTRVARYEERKLRSEKFPYRTITRCRSAGSITIDDVINGPVTLDLAQVNQVLLSWTSAPN